MAENWGDGAIENNKTYCSTCAYDLNGFCNHTYRKDNGCFQACYNCIWEKATHPGQECQLPGKYYCGSCNKYIPSNYNPFKGDL